MRILVIEDKESHRKSAEETLAGHDVTMVKSFDEAMGLIERKIDEGSLERLLFDAGFPTKPKYSDERWDAYWKAREEAETMSVIPLPFDVILTDMMMPMSQKTLAPGVFNPKEQVPYGLIIALKAALYGIRFVAMVTDTNHHQGAMSAAIDHLGTAYYQDGCKPNFMINGAKVMFVHAPFCEDVVGQKACSPCRGSGDNGKCSYCRGTGKVDDVRHDRKDWGKVLADLTA